VWLVSRSGSTSLVNYIYPMLFVLLPDKKNIFLNLLKIWCSFWSPEIIKIDFEAVFISAINKAFHTPLLLAVIFILSSPCGEKYKILVLHCNTKKKNNFDTHAECVLLSHTYILIKQKTGYVHEKCSTE
jgi:hypothetical protein